MSDKDLLDRVFDTLENKTKWLYEKDLIKNWFNVLSWTAITSVVFVIAKSSQSYFLFFVGAISVILLFFYGWHSIYDAVNHYYEKESEKNISAITLFLTSMLTVMMQGALTFYLVEAIAYVVSKST